MAKTPEEHAHQEWLGYVQPVGLVVSTPAMLQAQCYVNKNIMEEHTRFLSCLPTDNDEQVVGELRDLPGFFQSVLEWSEEDLVRVPQKDSLTTDLEMLEVVLPQYNETLRPSYAVPVFKPEDDENPWMILIKEHSVGTDLDEPSETDSAKNWGAPPQAKFERLLRETSVPIGLLSNGEQLRLVYSPRGETSGYATFNVAEMAQVNGRPIFAALHMLFENSRKYQNTVSTELAEQVLAALYELMRGFQAANDASKGKLLKEPLKNEPNHVYSGLLTVLMRLVFILYAEDRNLLSSSDVYSNHYSVTGLFNRLREEAGRYPDTMYQRFGAWSQLVTLFQLIFKGGQHGDFKLRGRSGYLFDPDRYPFLEGRQRFAQSQDGDTENGNTDLEVYFPRISDGVVFHVLQNLLILNGERLSYRSLDVEQIGSVYETVMGFNLDVATGSSRAIKPVKSNGAPATIDLDQLLEEAPKDRAKWLKEQTDQKLGTADLKKLKEADSVDALIDALDKKLAKAVTPLTVPKGAIVLQPSDERRRSGSHYTPRSLTEPIVRTTLEPILKQLVEKEVSEVWQPTAEDKRRYTKGQIELRIERSQRSIGYAEASVEIGTPHPQQILDLKVCDPAMGSGAFLVEACRQLGDELMKSWHAHEMVPDDIPPDEDEVLYARRLVAQRCLYGVDKNPMAVDLAKLSLWLVTLAKDHAFTFLDHSFRHGDSLVGLTREQIIGFHWDVKKQKKFGEELIQKRLDRALEARAKILNAREDVTHKDQEKRLAVADEAVDVIRTLGDACVSCFFAEPKKKAREEEVDRVFALAQVWLESFRTDKADVESRHSLHLAAARLRDSSQEHLVPAFHWEIEFPEVFSRENSGFDAFVGNPPFLGYKNITGSLGNSYFDWMVEVFSEGGGSADLCAYFFRRAYALLGGKRTLGLIATNTIAQGDTRKAGVQQIVKHGGSIYNATKRLDWAGVAAVRVSVVHIAKAFPADKIPVLCLDGKAVEAINSYLTPHGEFTDPVQLQVNKGQYFFGSTMLGKGFVLQPEEARELLAENEKNGDCVLPYLSGKDINNNPSHLASRFAINFGSRTLEEASKYKSLMTIVRERVKPDRDKLRLDNSSARQRRERWWRYAGLAENLYQAIEHLDRCIVTSAMASKYLSFSFQTENVLYSNALLVFPRSEYAYFASLQSRLHEEWTRFFSSSMKDDIRYSASDSFETFPFPINWMDCVMLESSGQRYYEHRASIMLENDQGLTDTYNLFHDQSENDEGVLELRHLHFLMDEAVLRAYGWDDLAESATCEFLLDYEEEEDDTLPSGKKKSKKKKPWRYRWPDDFRDEVLARLLELNEQRHKEELEQASNKSTSKKVPQKSGNTKQGKLL